MKRKIFLLVIIFIASVYLSVPLLAYNIDDCANLGLGPYPVSSELEQYCLNIDKITFPVEIHTDSQTSTQQQTPAQCPQCQQYPSCQQCPSENTTNITVSNSSTLTVYITTPTIKTPCVQQNNTAIEANKTEVCSGYIDEIGKLNKEKNDLQTDLEKSDYYKEILSALLIFSVLIIMFLKYKEIKLKRKKR